MSRKRQPRLSTREIAPTLFLHTQNNELLVDLAVRAVARRVGVSPPVALVIAELAGLIREQK